MYLSAAQRENIKLDIDVDSGDPARADSGCDMNA